MFSVQISKWYRSSHLTLGEKENGHYVELMHYLSGLIGTFAVIRLGCHSQSYERMFSASYTPMSYQVHTLAVINAFCYINVQS